MKGLSPLVGFALTILLITISVTVVITTIIPAFERLSDSNVIDEGVRNLQLIDTAIRQVAAEAEGSKRTINIRFSEGRLRIDANKELVKFEYDMKTDLSIEGLLEGIFVDKLPYYVNYFNYYRDGDVPTDINCEGNCVIEGSQLALKGFAWKNLGFIKNFRLEAKIVNESGIAEVFLIPRNFEDLVLYLPFDEGQNNVSYDYSKYMNNGTLYDANSTNSDGYTLPQWVNGKSGISLKFDGIDDYVEIGDVMDFNGTSSFSIAVWVKPQKSFWGRIISKETQNVNGRQGWLLVVDPSTTSITFERWRDDNGTGVGISIVPNEWVHVVAVYDGSEMKIYKNGELVNSLPSTQSLIDHTRPLTIGSHSEIHSFFNGTIDEVMIFNRSLTDNEVRALYQLTLRKLISSGITDAVEENINATLVLASPAGKTYFDNVKVKSIINRLVLTVPYSRIDISNSLSIGPGNTMVSIEKIGFNESSGKPLVRISVS